MQLRKYAAWNLMKLRLSFLAVLLSAAVGFFSGRDDFTLDIGDGYNVVFAGGVDACIGKADGRLLLSPFENGRVGPVVSYFITPDYILTKNHGRRPRNLFDGDTFKEADPSQAFYFVIAKSDDKVSGPFSEEEFKARSEVVALNPIAWKSPENPDVWSPLLGKTVFVAYVMICGLFRIFWITLPVLIGLILLDYCIRRKEKGR